MEDSAMRRAIRWFALAPWVGLSLLFSLEMLLFVLIGGAFLPDGAERHSILDPLLDPVTCYGVPLLLAFFCICVALGVRMGLVTSHAILSDRDQQKFVS
jgi:hypothetical protein